MFDAASSGAQFGATLTNSVVGVSNGLFTVSLDFGAGVFTGPDRWLEIGVCANGAGVFALLSPRQKLTATPYAVTAGTTLLLAFTGLHPLAVMAAGAALIMLAGG